MPGQDANPTTARTARTVQRRWPLVSGVAALVLATLAGVLIAARNGGAPLEIDTEWMDEIIAHRSPFWEAPSLAMNWLGGGLVGALLLPLAITVVLILFRRPWAALFFALASALSAGVVQVLKSVFGRARPEDILVVSDYGSFPSGHVANAATMAVVFGLLFSFWWVWTAGAAWTVAMLLSRTYLGAHWLTDTLGGLVLGAGVAIIVWAPLAARLHAENMHPHRLVFLPSRE